MHGQRSILLVTTVATSAMSLGAQSPGPDARGSLYLLRQTAERLARETLDSFQRGPDACSVVAHVAADATVHALRAQLDLALAACINEESATVPKFESCWREAFSEYSDGLDELADQHRARLALCELTGGGIYDPDLDGDAFVEGVDHPFLPYATGATWVYHKLTSEGLEEVVVTVTAQTKDVDDIECIIVRDTSTLDGELIEDTLDYFAQHEDGTVWYLGELAQNFEDGELVDLDGSWLAGEDGGLPGTLMMSRPLVGTTYRQELLLTEAEDAATVLALGATVSVPFGTFTGCLQTEDFSPLEPGIAEHKFYAPGIGLVLEVDTETGERLELVSFLPGS